MKAYVAPKYSKEQLELLDESEVSFPFSDDDAVYIGIDHQYQLTAKYFAENGYILEKELEGNNTDRVEQFLKYLRKKFYAYIYSHSKSTRRQINYLIAKRGLHGFSLYEYRQAFLYAMFLEGEYLLKNGDLSAISGVDLDTMQNMSKDVVRGQDRDMHPMAIQELKQLGLNYFGNYRFIPQGEDW